MFLAFLAALTATPATLPATMKKAAAGDTITLAAGEYGTVKMPVGDYRPALVIDANAARFTNISIYNTKGIEIHGGTVSAPPAAYYGVVMSNAARIRVSGMTITGVKTGISVGDSTDIDLIGNRLDGVRSDGINLGTVQRVNVIGNHCYNFKPTPPVFDAKGRVLKDGDHPDCIQGWSRLGSAPNSDILIEGNVAVGHMQGITFFDAGQGGADRIVIRSNDLTIDYWHGITVFEGRATVITGNRVRTIPGARMPNFPFQPIRAWISTLRGLDQRVCGNEVPATPGGEGTGACK